jgi:phosphorylase kinase alpha/beta subunit
MVSLHTGEEVESTAEYNHMQLDCVSLYLLYLVQMISSGLEIIYRFSFCHFKLELD